MKAKIKTKTVTMPAGEYYVGDPCYAVPDERWMEWLKAAASKNDPTILLAELDGYSVLGIGTAHGDGSYEGSDGFMYGVDAGLIGVVPVEVGDYHDDKYPAGAIMTTVEFDHEFDCSYEDGTIVLGHITIDTDSEDW